MLVFIGEIAKASLSVTVLIEEETLRHTDYVVKVCPCFSYYLQVNNLARFSNCDIRYFHLHISIKELLEKRG